MTSKIACERCAGSGEIGRRNRWGGREAPGPVPDDARGWVAVTCPDCHGEGVAVTCPDRQGEGVKKRDPRFQGLGGGEPARYVKAMEEAADLAALIMDRDMPPMTPQQRIDLAVSVARKVLDADDEAEEED